MYADSVSAAMKATIHECERRRKIQTAFNKKHKITPQTIRKAVRCGIEELAQKQAQALVLNVAGQSEEEYTLAHMVSQLECEMDLAARNLQFEKAAQIRDKIKELKGIKGLPAATQRRQGKSYAARH